MNSDTSLLLKIYMERGGGGGAGGGVVDVRVVGARERDCESCRYMGRNKKVVDEWGRVVRVVDMRGRAMSVVDIWGKHVRVVGVKRRV